jgi:hypothetical protein
MWANAAVDFVAKALREHFESNASATGILANPEDLGVTASGDHPGSIWHFTRVSRLVETPGWVEGGISMADWGGPAPKPTRFVGRLPGLRRLLAAGPPCFDAAGRYTGPIRLGPPGSRTRLIGKTLDRGWKTALATAWPPTLCKALAELVVDSFLAAGGKSLKVGGSVDDTIAADSTIADADGVPIAADSTIAKADGILLPDGPTVTTVEPEGSGPAPPAPRSSPTSWYRAS